MTIKDALRRAKDNGRWKASKKKPASAIVHYMNEAGNIDAEVIDLYSENKERELTDLWNDDLFKDWSAPPAVVLGIQLYTLQESA